MKNINWDDVQEELTRPEPGGYIAKIVKVTDNEQKQCLYIEWDFAEGELKGYNQSVYDQYNFWPSRLIKSYKDSALRFFKGFKTCVEMSNRNYVFRNDPQSLVGKYIGVVLGEEEYMKDGKLKTSLYVAEVRSGKAIRDGDYTVPELKKLSAQQSSSGSGYGGYNTPSGSAADFALLEDDDADLPF